MAAETTPAALEIRNLTVTINGTTLLGDVSMELLPGERHAVTGQNGAGKTTLLNLLSGEMFPDSGRILVHGQDMTRLGPARRSRAGIARSFQRNRLFAGMTVRENLSLSAATAMGRAAPLWRDPLRLPGVVATVQETAAALDLLAVLDQPVDTLPYGICRQAEIGMALANRPRLLLLDEPFAGIDPGGRKNFLSLLRRLPGTLAILLVEHDMDMIFSLADRITLLEAGGIVATGTPSDMEAAMDGAAGRT